ncbi:MAG: AraC family transcriptional regulator [Treponemataceae bacterium]|nr:AraC family transcriptional regulator [Treponemataceae bacterium]
MAFVPDIHDSFDIIKTLFQDAFGVQTVLMKSLEGSENSLDFGIRKIIWPDFKGELPAEFPETVEKRSILLTHSNLGFYNLVVYVSIGHNPECVGIGPFRDGEMDDHFFVNLANKWKLSADNRASIRQLYSSMPLISVTQILSFTQHLFAWYYPELADTPVKQVDYYSSPRKIRPDIDLITDYAVEFGEQYQSLVKDFITYLDQGKVRDACSAMTALADHTGLSSEHDMHKYRTNLIAINSMCHEHLLMQNAIHPANLLTTMRTLTNQIETWPRNEDPSALLMIIVREYCQLVRNYSFEGYSHMVRSAIHYITLHYADTLSLEIIADEFEKNPAYLSRQFHEETGKTVTDFIHETRIQQAKNLFDTTEVSIGDIASAVGIHDYSYFAKLFKKVTGVSPTEYRRGVMAQKPKVYRKPDQAD